MKKSTKIIAGVIAAICLIGLIAINRNSNKEQEQLVRSKQLQVVVSDEEKIYGYNEESEDYITFQTQMKRKNGDVFDKEYSGIELSAILDECGVTISEDIKVVATCADNYQVELTGTEILSEDNIYLVTQENGEELSEEDGPFMLVINNDEFSTRWAKNIISITVK